MDRADVVMASAPALIATHRGERSDILYVENGVDPGAFGTPRARPVDLPDEGRPIIGYHGMIARWFDFDLVANLADDLPEMSVVLVGPVDPGSEADLAGLTRRSNIRYLGPRPSDAIAAYVQGFDVGIVPFVVDELTEAVSPLKIYEYMAAGVPVVSTPLPVCVQHAMVSTAAERARFASSVVAALERSTDDQYRSALRKAADDASWSHRLGPVVTRLEELDLRRVPR